MILAQEVVVRVSECGSVNPAFAALVGFAVGAIFILGLFWMWIDRQ